MHLQIEIPYAYENQWTCEFTGKNVVQKSALATEFTALTS